MEVTIIRPGDPGFEEISSTCTPPKLKTDDEPPRPLFVEYSDRVRAVE